MQKDISNWQHSHEFHTGNPVGERRTRWVIALTAFMMVVEITAGWVYGSMALLADGWHMSSHVVALGVTAAAYFLTRRYAKDPRFAFGTWKIEILGGFASALFLLGVALFMVSESVQRLFRPETIQFNQAIIIACIGLVVNLASALLLGGHSHTHEHGHHHRHEPRDNHGHGHGHGHADLNLRAAYLHVLADATTSVLAIVALTGGKFWGWNWLDSVMGIVGAGVVSVWAFGLLRDTSRVLLDREMDAPVVQEIREALEADGKTRICDLHVWQVGRGKYACIAGLVTPTPEPPEHYKSLLAVHEEIVHVTVELHKSA